VLRCRTKTTQDVTETPIAADICGAVAAAREKTRHGFDFDATPARMMGERAYERLGEERAAALALPIFPCTF
jgi:hypothetical protein